MTKAMAMATAAAKTETEARTAITQAGFEFTGDSSDSRLQPTGTGSPNEGGDGDD